MVKVNWNRACPVDKRDTLVIEPWFESDFDSDRQIRVGCTITWRDANGARWGCRQVGEANPSDFATCVAAWVNDAASNGRPVEIDAASRAMISSLKDRLDAALVHTANEG